MPQTIHNMPLNSVVVCVCENFSMSSYFFRGRFGIFNSNSIKFHLKGCDMFEEDIEITWFKAEKNVGGKCHPGSNCCHRIRFCLVNWSQEKETVPRCIRRRDGG